MGIFRRIETGLEKAFEGGFGRTFKSHVQPVELARKLRKEMDEHRTISVSQVYVPNIYTIYLSATDREQFATYEASLRTELASYLNEHARRQAYTVPGRVRVVMETADELDVGMFGIAVATEEQPRLSDMPPHSASALVDDGLPPEFAGDDDPGPRPVRPSTPTSVASVIPIVPVAVPTPAGDAGAEPDPDEGGGAVVADDEALERHEAVDHGPVTLEEEPAASETALISAREAQAAGLVRAEWALVWEGGRHVLDRRAAVIGRGRDCDVVIDDRNVSRRHAEIVRDGDGFVIRDLDSTNGCAVNGRRVQTASVAAGDTVMLGTVVLTLEETRT
jgi:hypothetical protein